MQVIYCLVWQYREKECFNRSKIDTGRVRMYTALCQLTLVDVENLNTKCCNIDN